MSAVEVLFLGSGDAFGSGGRLQSCIHVRSDNSRFLIDCGASCLIGMSRFGIDPNDIGLIVISHLHGDHYGGIPFLVNGSHLVFGRTEPLTILGPPGTKDVLVKAMEILFPGSSRVARKFALHVGEYSDRETVTACGIAVTPYRNIHPQADPSFALRIGCRGRVIGYSGDTQWTDALLDVSRGADLFIAEAYRYERLVRGHMDYVTLMNRYGETGAKRLVLTHMGHEMLSMCGKADCECAEDGKRILL